MPRRQPPPAADPGVETAASFAPFASLREPPPVSARMGHGRPRDSVPDETFADLWIVGRCRYGDRMPKETRQLKRRNHTVNGSYLRRFADDRELLADVELPGDRRFPVSVEKAAMIRIFYVVLLAEGSESDQAEDDFCDRRKRRRQHKSAHRRAKVADTGRRPLRHCHMVGSSVPPRPASAAGCQGDSRYVHRSRDSVHVRHG
jgi:hypothetical protein